MLSSTGKTLAKNSVASVSAHNKNWEEKRMWAEFETAKKGAGSQLDPKRFFARDSEPDQPSTSSSSSRPKKRRKHSPSDSDIEILEPKKRKKAKKSKKKKKKERSPTPDFKWTKELDKLETSLPGRWGHDGYKTLYPEEFR